MLGYAQPVPPPPPLLGAGFANAIPLLSPLSAADPKACNGTCPNGTRYLKITWPWYGQLANQLVTVAKAYAIGMPRSPGPPPPLAGAKAHRNSRSRVHVHQSPQRPKAGPPEAAPEAVRQAVGGGCRSGWGRLLLVTNAIEHLASGKQWLGVGRGP